MRRVAAGVAMLAALAAAPGCDKLSVPGKTPFNGIDITGSALGSDFRLKDPEGKERTLADFRGKVVAIFFGYTQCPDVCPTTLADLANALQSLGPDAQRVQVLMVTVDPQRDTPEVLRNYVPAFNPTFLGLYGDAAATEKVTKDFKIYAAQRAGSAPNRYTVDHSSQTLVFDAQGRLRLLLPYGTDSKKIASDLKILLNS